MAFHVLRTLQATARTRRLLKEHGDDTAPWVINSISIREAEALVAAYQASPDAAFET